MLSDIINQDGWNFGLGITGNDFIIVSELPPQQLAAFGMPSSINAIALLQGDDYLLNNDQEKILFGNQGNDTIIGGDSNDTIYGGQDDDLIQGKLGNNLLFGNRGNDTLIGGSGNDTIYGGVGDDIIIGGSGNNVLSGDQGLDTLTGGSGINEFILPSSTVDQDVITNFKPGTDKMRVPDGVTIAELRIQQLDMSTLILLNGQTLATLNDVDFSFITTNDFIGEAGNVEPDDIKHQFGTGVNGSNMTFEQQVLQLVNEERARESLEPLTFDPLLAQAARTHSTNMARQDFFGHTGNDGSDCIDRIRATGFTRNVPLGENIAAGHTTAESVVDGWMDSPGHRANILNSAFTRLGVGHYFLEDDTGEVNYNHYWAQAFSG